jgi:RNase P/RNase MRP subunit p29
MTMNLINYTGLRVKIILTNNYYYVGDVISADENTLDLRDIKGNLVSVSKIAIQTIQEVKKC